MRLNYCGLFSNKHNGLASVRIADFSQYYSIIQSKEKTYLTRKTQKLLVATGCAVSSEVWLWLDTSSSSSSLSIGPIANATDVLQPRRLIVLTLSPPPVLTFPHSLPGTSTSTTTGEILVAKSGTVGENWLVILPEIVTSTSIQGSFTCHKSGVPIGVLQSIQVF